eukprot:COSAG04_NODE_9518_length_856_cov_0.951123_1_plen_134_part_10
MGRHALPAARHAGPRLGGWDSRYVEGVPAWEPLATCTDSATSALTRCSRDSGAWTPHAYGLQLAALRVGAGAPLSMPVDVNARGHNASEPGRGWSPHYTTIMPEAQTLWLNADANAEAVSLALAGSGFVEFPPG